MDKYNNLTFIRDVEPKIKSNGKKKRLSEFQCDCGEIGIKDYYSISSGRIKSCMKCGIKRAAESKIKHRMLKHKLYRSWQDMLNRCRNEKVDRYKNYGGRGIKVCEEWTNDFLAYYNWCINNGWIKGLSVDRIDVNGNYEPSNCRIVSPSEQHYNKQNTVYITINNEKISLAKFCNENSISYYAIWRGLKRGKDISYYLNKYLNPNSNDK